jgi:glucokinase
MAPRRVIGVDLGGTKIAAGLVDRRGNVSGRTVWPTPLESQADLLAALDEVVRGLVDQNVAALGFGIPSTLERGRVVSSVNIPLEEVDLARLMSERYGLAVAIDNDANAAAIAEWRLGAGRGASDMVMLTLGTGCGGGLILGGKPYRGFVGAAAELGHMVIEHDGRPCQGDCTGRGHLEPYVSGLAATAAAREAFGPDADAARLVEQADAGDTRARAILAEIGGYLGSALGTLVNLFDPEVIVIGGGFGTAAGEHLLAPARALLRREALRPGRDLVRVELSQLGPEAGLIGAGLVAFETLDDERP